MCTGSRRESYSSRVCLLLGSIENESETGVELRLNLLAIRQVFLRVIPQYLFLLLIICYCQYIGLRFNKARLREALHLKLDPPFPANRWPKPAVTHEALRMKHLRDDTSILAVNILPFAL
jgi:hypothetical protein